MLTDDELPPLPKLRWFPIPGPKGYLQWYRADDLREYGRAVERAAYEAAIKACIGMAGTAQCGEAIRALMEQERK